MKSKWKTWADVPAKIQRLAVEGINDQTFYFEDGHRAEMDSAYRLAARELRKKAAKNASV